MATDNDFDVRVIDTRGCAAYLVLTSTESGAIAADMQALRISRASFALVLRRCADALEARDRAGDTDD